MEAYTATEQVYPRTGALITKNWPYITQSWPPCNKVLTYVSWTTDIYGAYMYHTDVLWQR